MANGQWKQAAETIRYWLLAIRPSSNRWPLTRAHGWHAAANRSAPGRRAHVVRRPRCLRSNRKKRAESKAADVSPPGDPARNVARHQFGRALEQLQHEPDRGE